MNSPSELNLVVLSAAAAEGQQNNGAFLAFSPGPISVHAEDQDREISVRVRHSLIGTVVGAALPANSIVYEEVP